MKYSHPEKRAKAEAVHETASCTSWINWSRWNQYQKARLQSKVIDNIVRHKLHMASTCVYTDHLVGPNVISIVVSRADFDPILS